MAYSTAVFGGGCFWCTEAVFQRLKGVQAVIPGYAGGTKAHPTYEDVSSGSTGHAEVIRVEYDPQVISYRDLLEIFFATHDPTTLNRQGNDVGTQYRSVVFYTGPTEQHEAVRIIKELTDDKVFSSQIVTEVLPLRAFYEAEGYHRNYYNTHGEQPYCTFVIAPKLKKFKEKFSLLLKE